MKKMHLQMLSKLEVAMPDGYGHIFTLLNTDEEYKKTPDVQLVTAKRMIKAHFDNENGTEAEGKEGSMMCMYISNEYTTKSSTSLKCDHCGKVGHTAYKDGEPFCFSLKAAIKGKKSDGSSNKFKGKCFKCNKTGHKSADCRSKPKESEGATDVNSLLVSMVEFEDEEISNIENNSYMDMLGDTGAQGHVAPPTHEMT